MAIPVVIYYQIKFSPWKANNEWAQKMGTLRRRAIAVVVSTSLMDDNDNNGHEPSTYFIGME
jgi:hypothetical protein